jgi:hypothetical protein
MAERTNARLLKSREVQASVGSNPTPSAPCQKPDIALVARSAVGSLSSRMHNIQSRRSLLWRPGSWSLPSECQSEGGQPFLGSSANGSVLSLLGSLGSPRIRSPKMFRWI